MEKIKKIIESSEVIIKEELVKKIDIENIKRYLTKKEIEEVETKEDFLDLVKDKYNQGVIILDYRDLNLVEITLNK